MAPTDQGLGQGGAYNQGIKPGTFWYEDTWAALHRRAKECASAGEEFDWETGSSVACYDVLTTRGAVQNMAGNQWQQWGVLHGWQGKEELVDSEVVMLSAHWEKKKTSLIELQEQLQQLPGLIADLESMTANLRRKYFDAKFVGAPSHGAKTEGEPEPRRRKAAPAGALKTEDGRRLWLERGPGSRVPEENRCWQPGLLHESLRATGLYYIYKSLNVYPTVRPVAMMHTDHQEADAQHRSCDDVHWPYKKKWHCRPGADKPTLCLPHMGHRTHHQPGATAHQIAANAAKTPWHKMQPATQPSLGMVGC
ncbi:Dysbindin [Myotis davidii]|uniref:Dysbindin n=1 Tax=Myotis davidii TaxID=225400 RepID=L5LI17_MYODS|nr:Dysbindin [Myotis davidii]